MKTEQWLALGDSITWGYPVGPSISWTRHVSEAIGLQVDNQGINGDTLDSMADRLAVQLARRNYPFAVWMGGSNDVSCGFRLEAMQSQARRIAEQLEAAATPFAVGLPIPLRIGALDEQLIPFRRWLVDTFPLVIDFSAAFPAGRPEVLPDGVHPSAAGYAAMGGVAIPVIRKLLA